MDLDFYVLPLTKLTLSLWVQKWCCFGVLIRVHFWFFHSKLHHQLAYCLLHDMRQFGRPLSTYRHWICFCLSILFTILARVLHTVLPVLGQFWVFFFLRSHINLKLFFRILLFGQRSLQIEREFVLYGCFQPFCCYFNAQANFPWVAYVGLYG